MEIVLKLLKSVKKWQRFRIFPVEISILKNPNHHPSHFSLRNPLFLQTILVPRLLQRSHGKCKYLAVSIFLTGLAFGEEALPLDLQELAAKRAAAVERIDRTFLEELRKLKEGYITKRDLDSANQVDLMIQEVGERLDTGVDDEIKGREAVVGSWVFNYEGKARNWTFNKGGTVLGVAAVGGKPFRLTWELKDGFVSIKTISRKGQEYEWARLHLAEQGGAKMVTHANRVMMGMKK